MRIAHLTTVDISLRYLLRPQLEVVTTLGGEAIGISAAGPYVAELESEGIKHIALEHSTRGVDPVEDLKAAISLWRILKTERPDVLHTHTPKPGVYGRIVGRLVGVPVVINTIHGLYATEEDSIAKRLFVYLLEGIASRFSDRELVQSAEDYELVTKRHITRSDRTVLLGNGVDLVRFDASRVSDARRQELRQSIGAGSDQVVIGSVGRLVREKGFPELFEGAARLGGECLLVVIGPSEPEKEDGLSLEEIAAAEAAGVIFLGMLENVDEWYAAMDVFVLASHREGFPRAAMEASAMGLPVIATDIRGCREVVDDGVTGLLVPKQDPTALAAAMQRLAGSSEMRKEMGMAAHHKAREHFDESAIVDLVISTQISAMREKGIDPPLAGSDNFVLSVRQATPGDAMAIARLHIDGITTGFLPTLGVRFLTYLYRAMITSSGSSVLVAEDPYGPVGFVAGVGDVTAFYKLFIRGYGLRAGVAALPALIRPSTWRKIRETAAYDGDHLGVPAELLSMAVSANYRGRGLGRLLAGRLVEDLGDKGFGTIKVVVAEGNGAARRTYESVGFVDKATIEVHRGETSIAMVVGRSADH